MRIRLQLVFLLWTSLCPIMAQEAPVTVITNGYTNVFSTLEGLQASIEAKQFAISQTQKSLARATDTPTRHQYELELERLQADEQDLTRRLERVAVDVDTSGFSSDLKPAFDLRKELEKLAEPVISELKHATADSRIIEELRNEVGSQASRKDIATRAVRNLEALVASEPYPSIEKPIRSLLAQWQQRKTDAENRLAAAQYQLDTKLEEKQSLYESTRGFLHNFVRSRGLHLVLGIGIFCLVYFMMRGIYALYRKFKPASEVRGFASRFSVLIYHFCTVLFAVFSMLLVFNLTGDWFLLGISLFLLMGFIWASFKTLPLFVEQIKIMLNFGSVREKELIIWQGVPWNVDRLGLWAHLKNPNLSGGVLKLPSKFLVGHASRVPGSEEEYFPSRKGDWVELSNGKIGRVAYQTPQLIQVVPLGGSQIIIPTPEFIKMNPINMSTNFRREGQFGIDYKHIALATTSIPETLYAAIESGLAELVGKENLLNLIVTLKSVGSSSLIFVVQADFRGKTASKYDVIDHAITRIFVETCHQNDWKIPFPQLTISNRNNSNAT